MSFTDDQKRALKISAIAVGVMMYLVTRSQRNVAQEKCRRASFDLHRQQGMTEVDALDKSFEYCGTGGSDPLYKEAP